MRHIFWLCLKAACIALFATSAFGDVNVYVSTSGSDTTTCMNSAQPCRTINYAVGQGLPQFVGGGNLVVNIVGGGTFNESSHDQ